MAAGDRQGEGPAGELNPQRADGFASMDCYSPTLGLPAGNEYRVVVWIDYPYRVVYIRFIGTHAQYDRIDAQQV